MRTCGLISQLQSHINENGLVCVYFRNPAKMTLDAPRRLHLQEVVTLQIDLTVIKRVQIQYPKGKKYTV